MTETNIYKYWFTLLLCLMQTAGIAVYGQEYADTMPQHPLTADSIVLDEVRPMQVQADSVSAATADSIAEANKRKLLELTSVSKAPVSIVPTDSLSHALNRKTWIPDPVKATWLALVIPGGGQIYNRKYWKLPIVYGGFAGCAYALTWNNKMYKDYSQAYQDASNEKWDSKSITDLLPPGYLNRVSTSQLTETLRKRKDLYRRYRDLSIFAFIGVYLLSVVDAYVDAELSNFDITPDLSLRIEPAVFNTPQGKGISGRTLGMQCSLRF